MSRTAYVCHERKLVVFYSPKAACTTVAAWFVRNVLRIREVGMAPRIWSNNKGYRCPWKQAYTFAQKNYKSILFTRRPTSRIVSAFISKFYVYKRRPLLHYVQLEKFSQKLLNVVYPGKSGGVSLSFVQFLDAIQAELDRGKRLNTHWNSQFPRKNERKGKSIPDFNYVVRQENFDQDLALVNQALNINDYLPKQINPTKFPPHYSGADAFLGDIGTLQLHAQNILLKADNLINDEIQRKINRIYQEDYNILDRYYQ